MPTGGCESTAQKGVAVLLVFVAVLVVWYVSMFVKDKDLLGGFNGAYHESMCGGMDQGCHCSGNETFSGGKYTNKSLLIPSPY